jgi:uncharacterized protein with FMN-binding domain
MPSFIRAAAPAVAIGGAAVALVALFDPAIAGIGSSTAAADEATGSTAGAQRPGSGSTPTPAQPRQRQTTPTQPQQTQPAQPQAEPTQPQAQPDTTNASCDTAELVDGPTVTTRWGPVQVAAAVVDGKVCRAQAQVWPDGDPRSSQISAYVIPKLDAMASEQGTAFDSISGATYTSEGYRTSLQALLDQLG